MEENEEENSDKKSSKALQTRNKSFHFKSSVWISSLSVLVALISIMLYLNGFNILQNYFQHPRSFYESYYQDSTVEPDVLNLFMSYDENLDGKIDPKEFVHVARRLFGKEVLREEESIFGSPQVEENWDQSGEKIIVNASFKPLVLSSMTKFAETKYPEFDKPLEMLKSWRKASKPTLTLPVSAFTIFIPEKNIKLGEPWYIIFPKTTKYGPGLSSHRYVAPLVRGNAAIIHRLLTMFHSRPFTMTRLMPQGTAACVQAYNDQFLKIAFRIHAEFQINEPPLLPFWFSPAQFAGSIVISRDGKHVQSFNMAVPNNRSLNVDMEWLMPGEKNLPVENSEKDDIKPDKTGGISENDPYEESVNMEVDIGYVPEMEINSNGPSCLRDENTTECSNEKITENIAWESELTQHDVEQVLMKFFYPFQEVLYLPFKEAFKKSKELNKPMHHILLWGALDDQSC